MEDADKQRLHELLARNDLDLRSKRLIARLYGRQSNSRKTAETHPDADVRARAKVRADAYATAALDAVSVLSEKIDAG